MFSHYYQPGFNIFLFLCHNLFQVLSQPSPSLFLAQSQLSHCLILAWSQLSPYLVLVQSCPNLVILLIQTRTSLVQSQPSLVLSLILVQSYSSSKLYIDQSQQIVIVKKFKIIYFKKIIFYDTFKQNSFKETNLKDKHKNEELAKSHRYINLHVSKKNHIKNMNIFIMFIILFCRKPITFIFIFFLIGNNINTKKRVCINILQNIRPLLII